MATITAGNPYTIDAQFGLAGQDSPDAVVFRLAAPDGEIVEFVWNVDPQVTNPAPDYFECALGVLHEVQQYTYSVSGYAGSDETETQYGTIFVIASVEDPEALTPPGPILGPAITWITGEDVAACVAFPYGSNPAVFDMVAVEASMALYEISGRRFPGLQERTVRPCSMNCPCQWGGPASYGFGPYWFSGGAYGTGGSWAWYNERGDRFGCKPMSKVNLAGYPVREILEVLIDGDVLPEFNVDDGSRQWRLDKWRYLVRMDQPPVAPSTVATPMFWPGCQNMSLDADQPGTFQVKYRWGSVEPPLARSAAVEVAQQLWLACPGAGGGGECVLPAGVTKVVRQEVTIERSLLANWLDPTKSTGLVQTDLFLQAYAGGMRRGRRSAVFSPDLQSMARKVGI